MSRVIVAEDSPTQAEEIRFMLEDEGFQVELHPNGAEALKAVGNNPPDVVLTDLDMPVMNGLELVEAVRAKYPRVPVILMTAYGSEDIAIQALQRGAANYVPKRNLARDLISTIQGLLTVVQTDRDKRRLSEFLMETESTFRLENDVALTVSIIAHVQETLASMQLVDENERIRVGVALEEAIHNAIYHGNLELSSEQLRDSYSLEDGGMGYFDLLEKRRKQAPYKDRRVHVSARVSRDGVVCVVRDEGPGFNHGALPKGNDPALLGNDHQRGLMLINSFMDEIKFNDRGNEITMIKRRAK